MSDPVAHPSFVSAFRSHGVEYADEGWQVIHPELTWSVSTFSAEEADGGTRTVLGCSLAELGTGPAPANAEDCYLVLPLDMTGEEVGPFVQRLVAYVRSVDSLPKLRERYAAGDFDRADIVFPLVARLRTSS